MFKKKGLQDSPRPKLANEILAKIEKFSIFAKFSIAGLGAWGVSQDKIFKIFGKFGKFRTFFIPLVSPYGKYSPSNFRLKIAVNTVFYPKAAKIASKQRFWGVRQTSPPSRLLNTW